MTNGFEQSQDDLLHFGPPTPRARKIVRPVKVAKERTRVPRPVPLRSSGSRELKVGLGLALGLFSAGCIALAVSLTRPDAASTATAVPQFQAPAVTAGETPAPDAASPPAPRVPDFSIVDSLEQPPPPAGKAAPDFSIFDRLPAEPGRSHLGGPAPGEPNVAAPTAG